ncbi:MAG: hypothetical protein WBZ48_12525 [Bacteroidota bacterium]
MAKKVLVVTHDFPPIGEAGSCLRVVKFLKYLHNSELEFMVLAPDREKSTSWTVQKSSSSVLMSDVPPGVKVFRTRKIKVPPGPDASELMNGAAGRTKRKMSLLELLKRLLKASRITSLLFPDKEVLWGLTAVPKGVAICLTASIDVVYAVGPPISSIFIGAIIAFLTRRKLISDFKDERIGTRDYALQPALSKLLYRLSEAFIVWKSNKVIVVTQESLINFTRRYTRYPDKFVMIRNGADIDEIEYHLRNVEPSAVRKRTEKFVIFNAGGYSPGYRNAENFFRAIGMVFRKHPVLRDSVEIRFLGQGVRDLYGDVIDADENNLSPNIVELPLLERHEYIQQIKDSNLLILIQTLGFKSSVAGTFYEYWAAGEAPILLLGEESEMWHLLNDFHLGVASPHNDVNNIAGSLESMLLHPGSRERGALCPDRKILARQLENILVEL